eukprot:gene16945-biopygen4808
MFATVITQRRRVAVRGLRKFRHAHLSNNLLLVDGSRGCEVRGDYVLRYGGRSGVHGIVVRWHSGGVQGGVVH